MQDGLSVPRTLLGRDEGQTKLLHRVTSIVVDIIQARPRIRLRRTLDEIRDVEARIADVVVGRQLVPVEHGQHHLEGRLVPAHVEEELLVPHGIERVPDHTGAKDLFAEGDHDKGVHVPAGARHCPRGDELFRASGRGIM